MADEPAAAAPPEAAELVQRLFALLKAAAVYERGNAGYLRHATEARETLSRALAAHGTARLEARGDTLFFNGRRVRFPVEGAAASRFLLSELGRRGVGVVEFHAGCDPAQLDAFVFALRATDPRKGEGLAQLRARLEAAGAAAVALLPPAEDETGEGGAKEEGDGRLAAQKAFFQAVRVVESVMTGVRDGRATTLAPAKRVVQTLVERVADDEQTLFELTTLRSFDEYTFAHCVNVCVYSIAIGSRLGLDRAALCELGFAGLFHDLGKTKLPLTLIDKPDEYDAADWARMRRHPALGVKALLGMRRPLDRTLARAVVVAFEHHLGLDGSGYPRLEHPRRQDLFARVCAIADSFDAITSGRVYSRRPVGPSEALSRMMRFAGTSYDPFLLKVFVSAVGVFPIGTPLRLSDGRIGVVWRNGSGDLLRPKVRVLSGAAGGETVEVVDLAAVDAATGRPGLSAVGVADPGALGVGVQRFLAEVDLAVPAGAR